MAAWKQLVVALVILAAAVVGWAFFFPGAPEILARWGIDWAQAAQSEQEQAGTSRKGGRRNGGGSNGGGSGQTLVVTAPATTATINDRLQAIGTGRAKASVTVNPYATGRLIEITATVRQQGGQGRRDRPPRFRHRRDRASTAPRWRVDDAQSKYDRAKSLRASNTTQRGRPGRRRCRAEQCQARPARRRTCPAAPLDRRADRRHHRHRAGRGRQLCHRRDDDRHDRRPLHASWSTSGCRSASPTAVKVGADVSATPIASSKTVIERRGRRRSTTASTRRAARCGCRPRFANPDDSLRAGMSFQVAMKFPGETYPAVSPLAIQWGADGAFVWSGGRWQGQARAGAHHPAQHRKRAGRGADRRPAIMVVTEGVQSVREGGEVRVAGASAGHASAA